MVCVGETNQKLALGHRTWMCGCLLEALELLTSFANIARDYGPI
jgi:hypothetical protein